MSGDDHGSWDRAARPTGGRDRPDRDRGAVYVAEDQVGRILASRHRAVRLGRRVVVLPPALTFGGLEAVAAFVTGALAHPATRAAYPGVGPVEVVPRRGFRQATYSAAGAGSPAQIRIPAADRRGTWALAQTVVLHELAHHLVPDGRHGPAFRAALAHLYRVHLGAEAAEVLHAVMAPLDDLPPVAEDVAADPALRRVTALLAKAAGTTSTEEAQAYLAKANTLAARHSVDLAVAALATPQATSGPTHRMLTIGRPGGAANKLLVSLYVRLAADLGIKVDVGPRSAYVLAYGLPGDLDRVEAIYATASTVMLTGATDHARSGAWRGQDYAVLDSDGRRSARPVTATVARNAFCIGFIERVVSSTAGTGREGPAPAPSEQVALALRRKDLVVSDYHRSASRARGAWRGTASGAAQAGSSRRAGQRAGEQFGRGRLTQGGPRALGPGGQG